jgi:hypothetical protein
MELFAWNAVLTVLLALLGWAIRTKDSELLATKDELARVTILVNRTREEVAKEYVTKSDLHTDINRILDRLDRLDNKLDTFIKEHRNG